MSEFINNRSERINKLFDFITRFIEGKDGKMLYENSLARLK